VHGVSKANLYHELLGVLGSVKYVADAAQQDVVSAFSAVAKFSNALLAIAD